MLAVTLATLAAPPAAANGKFPAAGQIVVDPGDPAQVFVRTTFGILVSRDAGQAFDWICESGAGYAGNVDPGIAVTGSGAVLAGISDGLLVGRDAGCGFALAGGAIAGQPIADVSVSKSDPTIAIALSSAATGNAVFLSMDDAATWTPAGAALPPTFRGLTLDAAPSDPSRIYVSGLDESAGNAAALARTLDAGATWEILPIPPAGGRAPYLAAVDPVDPAIVYVRLDGTPGTLLVSRDAGASWTSVFTIPGYIQAFALSPDGKTVLAGGRMDGVWRAPATTYAFERVSAMGVQCLSWSGADVYACGSTFAVGRSTDMGSTFTPLLRLECVRGPLACDAATTVGAKCPGEWPALRIKIGSMYCADGAGGSSGTGSTKSDTGAPTGGSGGGGGSGSPNGCACGVGSGSARGGEPEERSALAWVGVAALLMASRRKRAARRR